MFRAVNSSVVLSCSSSFCSLRFENSLCVSQRPNLPAKDFEVL